MHASPLTALSTRIRKHALGRLNFADSGADVPAAQRLTACKTFLRLENAMMRMRHEAGESGVAVAHARAATIDVMLAHLFDYAIAAWKRSRPGVPAPEVALVALGGYGRAQLSPLSDIDIMFLYPSNVRLDDLKDFQQHLVDEILYTLWDCGLKVGHSSRTTDDAFAEARADIQTKTALLEARFIAGSDILFENFFTAYENFYRNEGTLSYIASRLKNQTIRRAKYGDTVFLQEPDIKNGVGGLRDYHSVLWLAHVKLGLRNVNDLVEEGYLQRNQLRDFKRAYDFLMRVRNELHFNSRHPTDLLDLEQQPRIALGLGYANHDELARVEQFMHDYYRAAQTIYRVAKYIEHRLSLTADPIKTGATAGPSPALSLRDSLRLTRHQKTQHVDGFIQRGNELTAEHPGVFRESPERLIRVFRYAQQLGIQPDFTLQTLIRDNLPLINRRVINSPDCAASFRAIMHTVGNVHPTLSLMHELGVLGRYLPEFDTLTCLVQHEYYHRYTADIHTLNAIRELDRIFLREEDFTGKYLTALHETPAPSLLYLILLLHDIGKADGVKGHAENGALMAGPVLERLQVDASLRPTIIFIIKNHLAMARFWQKRDVDDPQTAAAFAGAVQTADNLRYLYVHTFCDSRSTSAELWNGYKDALHTTLYRATSERLMHDTAAIAARNSERKQLKLKQLLSEKIPGIPDDEITAHFNRLPERYFIQADTAEIALHVRMVNQLLKSISAAESLDTLRPVIEWRNDLNRAFTIVNVVTWDRAGLFYKLAGALSVAGVNILGAKVISRTDHIAIDTFYITEPGGGVVQNQAAQDTFAKNVEQTLVANRDLYPDILAQAKRIAPHAALVGSLQNTFPPLIDVYNERSMQRTIVEIQARDQIGLLYRLAKAISDHGFGITFARIGTERGIAIDTFYIENTSRETAIEAPRLRALRDELEKVVIPPETPAPGPA
ncbi:[protein-PII] uridylyltransferase [Ereboglobus luteus]|uniref:Bifunctional uridylyltransferase/uridylyl-removing enzyme n=1 Tax=Ereboglobus luteus TaxID=1796921 RepID=A0A2U8DZF5_9BACT|nr:[protein-PII] uridylyltransferase [Ereboglobus luteus]AWI07998.1 [protein-PII] uridylyltransferase [Ereboglobus luteus]